MKGIDSHIELLKEKFEKAGIKLSSITWGRLKLSHERFAQQHIDANKKELVDMLEKVLEENHCTPDTDKKITELITKHKQS